MSAPADFIIVGAGISGLVTAWRLHTAQPAARIRVIERRVRLGGCLKRDELGGYAGLGADVGAEASLYVRPETRALAAELDLEPVYPDRSQHSQLFVGGRLHEMPAGTLMGVPGDPQSLHGILSEPEIERVAHEQLTDPVAGDVAVGEFLAARLGDAVVDKLIDPLLGGVYSGRCRDLSMAATVPALLPAANTGAGVLETVRQTLARRTATRGANVPGTQTADAPPTFMSLPGGINGLVDALATRLRGAGVELLTATEVEQIARSENGWSVTTAGGHPMSAANLVLAVPAYAAAGLLRAVDEPAAERIAGRLGAIPYANSALVNTVLRLDGELTGSGFLVPPAEPAFIKASTFASNKWPWLRDSLPEGLAVVRMSIGRYGDPASAWSELSDAELIDRAVADWSRITGRHDELVHAGVQRWNQALPQYLPGHLERTAELDADLAGIPGLGLVGSAFDGVGIPACIKRATTEAARLSA
ncbi:protoporphyrinogen oxidase [Brevibacterium sp. 50QC2O2]|uniref:protoporphyrinogen oxidase n=1 Tax=Brevibacterium sp. 50QC2O2 TaxID=2968459 RepID=UPI00211C2F60|nr:protoporphyrinogen oxidase [Brevibacterium sp. 50QC2O2]MCQ9388398.1 protoporphyrinogen oxidase [Brevibacterium sp. 50QC2O2]